MSIDNDNIDCLIDGTPVTVDFDDIKEAFRDAITNVLGKDKLELRAQAKASLDTAGVSDHTASMAKERAGKTFVMGDIGIGEVVTAPPELLMNTAKPLPTEDVIRVFKDANGKLAIENGELHEQVKTLNERLNSVAAKKIQDFVTKDGVFTQRMQDALVELLKNEDVNRAVRINELKEEITSLKNQLQGARSEIELRNETITQLLGQVECLKKKNEESTTTLGFIVVGCDSVNEEDEKNEIVELRKQLATVTEERDTKAIALSGTQLLINFLSQRLKDQRIQLDHFNEFVESLKEGLSGFPLPPLHRKTETKKEKEEEDDDDDTIE